MCKVKNLHTGTLEFKHSFRILSSSYECHLLDGVPPSKLLPVHFNTFLNFYRKDKRIKEENNGSDQTESNGKENMVKMNSQKKSKQNRRLLHNKDVTPIRGIPPTSDDNKNNLVKKKGTNESFEGEVCILYRIHFA